jgi:regulator of cell morphogenesis and NO signaling
MAALSAEATVGRLVAEKPGRSRVFEALGVDYCCGGDRPLGEVCAEKGLDAATVLRMLAAYEAEGGAEDGADWTGATAGELADHIEEAHHDYLRGALPRLDAMVDKVARVHWEGHPELRELREVFRSLRAELEAHMAEEERVLFPACRGLDAADAPDLEGLLEGPLGELVREHEEAGRALARMRELTGGYEPPADACNTYRAMLDGLAELERDTHLHIHEENNVLFPKVRAAETSAGS